MRRTAAPALLEEILRRLTDPDHRADEPTLDEVQEVYVYGSYVRGKRDPGDVDVLVNTNLDPSERGLWQLPHISPDWNYATLRTELRGRKRSVHVEFDEDHQGQLGHRDLLWCAGDSLDTARGRLTEIAAREPAPGADEPDRPVIADALAPLSRQVSQPKLAEFSAFVDAGALRITPVTLAEGDEDSSEGVVVSDLRTDHPKRRALLAAAAALVRAGYPSLRRETIDTIALSSLQIGRLGIGPVCVSPALATLRKHSLETALWDIAAGAAYYLLVLTPTTSDGIRALEFRLTADPELFAHRYAKVVGVGYRDPADRAETEHNLRR